MALLQVSEVSKLEEDAFVLHNISFTQQQAQKLAIAGATGSGKTSLLKMIAGLAAPTSGTLLFDGERIKGPDERLLPGHPSIAYLSQYFELRNHYRVKDFLSMASKVSEAEADEIYRLCRIEPFLERWTHQLSGGEKQRIALARLLITSPKLLLLDEPYSNLDPFHKAILKSVIDDLSKASDITCILVSHDPIDTLSWADEILVLKQGELHQKGSPEDIYFGPVDEYAASLFGKYNLISHELLATLNKSRDDRFCTAPFIRPEEIKLVAKGEGANGEVRKVRFMGSFYELEVYVTGVKLIVITSRKNIKTGQEVFVAL